MRPLRFTWTLCLGLMLALASAAHGETRTMPLLNGKNLDGWKYMQPAVRSHWTVGKATLNPTNPEALEVSPGGNELINATARGIDIYTTNEFGDCHLELDLMVPKGANSGVYLMRTYEVQLLDSYGRTELQPGDMGGIYGVAAPRVNACTAPGTWQHLVIDFRAPRFNVAGEKTANARFIAVKLNGKLLHENLELQASTAGPTRKERAKGPLELQGDHGPVAFRNIQLTLPD